MDRELKAVVARLEEHAEREPRHREEPERARRERERQREEAREHAVAAEQARRDDELHHEPEEADGAVEVRHEAGEVVARRVARLDDRLELVVADGDHREHEQRERADVEHVARAQRRSARVRDLLGEIRRARRRGVAARDVRREDAEAEERGGDDPQVVRRADRAHDRAGEEAADDDADDAARPDEPEQTLAAARVVEVLRDGPRGHRREVGEDLRHHEQRGVRGAELLADEHAERDERRGGERGEREHEARAGQPIDVARVRERHDGRGAAVGHPHRADPRDGELRH